MRDVTFEMRDNLIDYWNNGLDTMIDENLWDDFLKRFEGGIWVETDGDVILEHATLSK